MAFVIAATVILLDQITKIVIQTNVSLHNVPVIKGFFSLVYLKNTGAAWSMFSGMTGVLALVSAVAVGVLIWYLTVKKPVGLTRIALALMLGGAAGNLIDRLFLQYVRDFLSFNIFGYAFPVFNIADVALCIGVFLLAVSAFTEEEGK